jgi:hypothetical protein
MKETFGDKHPWIRLLLITILLTVVLGIPLGYLAVLFTWLDWLFWVVLAAVGLGTFAFGAFIFLMERRFPWLP